MQNKTSQPMPEIEAPEHPQNLLEPPADTPSKVVHVPKPTGRHRRWPYVLILIILVLAGLYWWRGGSKPAATGKAGSAKSGRNAANGPTPVVAVQAQTGNIGVY